MRGLGSVIEAGGSELSTRPSLEDARTSNWLDIRRLPGTTPRISGSVGEAAASCASILSSSGPSAAVAHLNGRTRFRFTGIYRFEPPLLRNLYLYDRENPALNLSGAVSRIEQTFCSIVVGENRFFNTGNAQEDLRLGSHPARERVLSYCGVPIRREDGSVWGTLCHFDVRPRLMLAPEKQVLEALARLLTQCVIDPAEAD